MKNLVCADKAQNLASAQEVLAGTMGPFFDIVCLNAGAALWVCGRETTIERGVETAREMLASGLALEKTRRDRACIPRGRSMILDEIIRHKMKEVAAQKKRVSLKRVVSQIKPKKNPYALLRALAAKKGRGCDCGDQKTIALQGCYTKKL